MKEFATAGLDREMSEHRITDLLGRLQEGDQSVWPELLAELDSIIRPIAISRLVAERPGGTWEAGDLVQTAVVQLLRSGQFQKAGNRSPLIKGAALVIRNILIDRARRRKTAVNEGFADRVPIDDVIDRLAGQSVNAIDLGEVLEKLQKHNPLHHEIVMLRFFGGQSLPEISRMLGLSLSTIENYWYKEIKPWLFVMLRNP